MFHIQECSSLHQAWLRINTKPPAYPKRKLLGLLYFAQDAQVAHWMCQCATVAQICARLYLFPQCAIYAQDLPKIVLISPMRNICTRFAQDCTYFPNAQCMRKICARLYLFLQCAIYAQDCTYFPNAQYMCNICSRLYLTSNLKC